MRGLLREAMRGLVPDRVRLRPDKAYFETALADLFRAIRHEPWLDDLLSMRELAGLGLVEPKPFRAELDRMVRENDWFSLWPPIAVEAFLRGLRSGRALAPSPRTSTPTLQALA
jgi:hypothetical protein